MKIFQDSYRSLRGGGVVCSKQQIPKKVQPEIHIEYDLIQHIIKDVEFKSQGILEASKRIGLNESKENITKNIGWFHRSSQFFNQIRQNNQMVQENIKIVLTSLEVLLEAIINVIQSQKFYAWLILRICNSFSLIIFIYFINNPEPPMKLQDQEKLLQYLAEIQLFINQPGWSISYENSIQYEFELLQMCTETCPTNSKEGQEIIINTFSGIISSIAQMSPSSVLLSALGQGALYLYKENSKRRQKETFQILFYIEQLKWQIIEQIQNGKGLHSILIVVGDNYRKLISKSHSWIIKCSWIKMISELISYQPLITQVRFKQLMHQYQFDKSWDQVISKKIIIPIDENKLIGIIQLLDLNDQAVKILQKQYTVFEQLKNICLNGNQDIPKFENLIQLHNEKEQQKIEDQNTIAQIVKLQQYLENIKINELQEGSKQLLTKYQDYIDGFISLKEYINSNQQQFLSQIEQLSAQNSDLNKSLCDFYLQSNIVNQQLLRITEIEKKELNKNNEILIIDKYILVILLQNYYNIILEFRLDLINPMEQFEEFCKYFPENNLKLSLISQENTLFVKEIFDKIIDNDFNQLIIQLELSLKNLQQKCRINPIMLISKYSGVLDGLLSVIFTNLRQEINIEQQHLYYFSTLISYDKKLIEEQFNQVQNKKMLIFYSILSGIEKIYEQLSQIVFEFKFDNNQASLFKTLQIQQVLQVFCNQIQLEVNQLSRYNVLIDPNQKQDDISFLIELLTYNKILHKYRNLILESSQYIVNIKSKINNLKTILNESNKQPEIIDQLIKNQEKLNKYLRSEDDHDKQNLISIFTEIMQLLYKIKQSKFDIDLNLIENAIKINKILELDGFQQFQEVQQQVILKQKEILDKIIDSINIKQDQIFHSDKVSELLDRILINIDQVIKKLNDQQIVSQKIDQNNSNQFILKISQYQNDKDQNKCSQTELQQDYNKIMEEFKIIIKFNKSNIEEIIQNNFDIIQQLPCLSIPDDYVQKVIFTNQQNKIYQQKVQEAGFLQTIQDSLNNEQWRIKEYFYFNCLIIYQSVSNSNIKNKIGQIILYGKFKETDFRVIQTLKNQEFKQQMEQLINHQWQESKEDLKVLLQDSLNKLQNIQLQLQGEERKVERENLQQQHRDLEDQIEQQLKNVNEIGDVLGITINFLKDIQKDLALIQKKLDNILNQIESMGQDIKFLRGKSPQQLLEIRMEQVISNKVSLDSQNVYVQIFTKEYDIKNNKEKEERTPLFNHENYDNGEVDEFLNEPKKSSLLIHGIAGAGKSLSARKIEEHLWIQYQKKISNKVWEQINETITIPIFIQLPALKEPKFNAIEETLESAIYQFDLRQINQLKEIIQSNNKIKLLLIMDSYDELAKQNQQINLIQTNKINQWKHSNEKNNPKVITTSRSEIFTNTYRSWFQGDISQNDESLKEVRLLSFDEEQRFLFLKQFSQLQLKLKIKELLEIISKNPQQDQILQNTLIIFDKIQYLINQDDQFILSNQSSQQIIDTLSKHPDLLLINKEQQKSFNKQIQILWSAKQYEVIINQLNLKEMLETPFFMNIVVAVLPQMNEKLYSQNYIKIRFSECYMKNKISQIENIVCNYQCNKLNYQDIYKLNEIELLKTIKHYIFINESYSVWEALIDSNFFKNFNAQKQCIEVIELIEKSFSQRKEIFSITQKEPDNLNYLVIYKSLNTKTQTIYDFYQEFLNNYIEQQRQKLSYSSEISDQNRFLLDIHEYAMKLAVVMTKQNETVIEIKQQGILFRKNQNKDPYSEYFQDQDKYTNYRILIRKCLPIKQKANFFQFHHKSIQEYLFARQIVEFLQDISSQQYLEQIIELRNKNQVFQNINEIEINDKDFLNYLYSNYLNQDLFLSQSQMQGQVRFIKAALQNQLKLQNICYLLSLLSSICPKFVQISSNALFLYSNLLLHIENKDFSGIIIENISLNGINFVNCNFNESQLRNVSINGINLNYSNLTRVNWIDCYYNDLPSFKEKQSKISCICFLKDEKYIISGHEDGSIKVWDKQKIEVVNQYLTDKSQVIDITPLDDGAQYAVLHQYSEQNEKFYKLKFWKKQNDNLVLEQDIKINMLWSKNQQFFAYQDEFNQNQINVCDKNQKFYSSTFLKEIAYLQIQEDKSLIYVIFFNQDYYIEEDVCVWNFIDNTKYFCSINKIKELEEIQQQKIKFKFSQNFKFLVMVGYQSFFLFNLNDNTHMEFNLENIEVCEFSYNERYLGIGGDFLTIFDIQSQSITQKLYGFNQKIQNIIFNSILTEIITLSQDGLVKYWDLKQCLQNIQQFSNNFQKEIDEIQYSINGNKFFVKFKDQLDVYDSNSGQLIDSVNIQVENFIISPIREDLYIQQKGIWFCYNYNFKVKTQLDIASDYELIISSNGKFVCTQNYTEQDDFIPNLKYTFQLLQIDLNNKVLSKSATFFGPIRFICFINDCQTLYYFDGQNLVSILFQKDPKTEIHSFQKDKEILLQISLSYYIYDLHISHDNQKLFIIYHPDMRDGTKCQLIITDIITQKLLHNYSPQFDRNYQIQFSLDNKFIYIASDTKINIIDSKTFKQIGDDLFGHNPYTNQLIVSPNGQQFISLGADNKIKIWEINTNFQIDKDHQSPYYLKLTIPQKSSQHLLIFNTILEKANITSHLGYNKLK